MLAAIEEDKKKDPDYQEEEEIDTEYQAPDKFDLDWEPLRIKGKDTLELKLTAHAEKLDDIFVNA